MRISMLKTVATSGIFPGITASAFAASKHPNTIFILADDQGWNALSTRMDPDEPGSGSM